MIVFCGYANNDVTVQVPHVPVLGERVQATSIISIDGGMNANAAVSAARMGAAVRFAGAVGSDARSEEFLENLERDGVDTDWAPRDAFLSTAVVLIAEGGDRSIISQDDANDAGRIAAVIRRIAATRRCVRSRSPTTSSSDADCGSGSSASTTRDPSNWPPNTRLTSSSPTANGAGAS
jgi:sulfofructose kinase